MRMDYGQVKLEEDNWGQSATWKKRIVLPNALLERSPSNVKGHYRWGESFPGNASTRSEHVIYMLLVP